MFKKRLMLSGFLMLSALLLSGCGKKEAETTPQPAAPAPIETKSLTPAGSATQDQDLPALPADSNTAIDQEVSDIDEDLNSMEDDLDSTELDDSQFGL